MKLSEQYSVGAQLQLITFWNQPSARLPPQPIDIRKHKRG